MTRSKDKGTRWETMLVAWLRDNGFRHAERRALRGTADAGDVSGVPGFVIEAKDCVRIDFQGWADELEAEMEAAGVPFGFVALKRTGTTDPGEGYAMVKIRNMAALAEIVSALYESEGS